MAEAETPAAPGSGEGNRQTPPSVRRGPGLPLPGMHIGMPTGMPGRVLWWGGLAALAVFDVVDWPVAVLVGAGSWVAEQAAKAAAAEQAAKAAQRQGAEPPRAG